MISRFQIGKELAAANESLRATKQGALLVWNRQDKCGYDGVNRVTSRHDLRYGNLEGLSSPPSMSLLWGIRPGANPP